MTRREESMEEAGVGPARGGKILLWKGFPKELVDDQVLGATAGDAPQAAGAGGETEAANEGCGLQPGTAGLGVKTTA